MAPKGNCPREERNIALEQDETQTNPRRDFLEAEMIEEIEDAEREAVQP